MNSVLLVLPSVPLWIDGDKLVFDRKFYDGMLMYNHLWPGVLKCLIRVSYSPLPEFGTVRLNESELDFEINLVPEGAPISKKHIEDAEIILASGDAHDQLHLSHLCKIIGVKCVFIIEYIAETRYQITRLEAPNFIVRLRRYLFVWSTERKRRAAFRLADGIQANGTAAFSHYGTFADSMLYLDSRVSNDMLISDAHLKQRLRRFVDSETLQLAYSGRLLSMKGADHLIHLANRLRARGVKFHLWIYGAGSLYESMLRDIDKYNLGGIVSLLGAVDFEQELIPNIRENIDLYVLLHRQSDPSCTYLETLSCGIPIVGYENQSMLGLLDTADIGWGVKLNDIDGVANVITELAADKQEICSKSRVALDFASRHCFEMTYKRRIDHLIKLFSNG